MEWPVGLVLPLGGASEIRLFCEGGSQAKKPRFPRFDLAFLNIEGEPTAYFRDEELGP
jgi:hypothetical protein